MLSDPVRQFVEAIRIKNVIGCILAPEKDLSRLLKALNQSGLFMETPAPVSSLSYFLIREMKDLTRSKAPGVLILAEEDYSADPSLQEKVRDKAAYFLNVRSSSG